MNYRGLLFGILLFSLSACAHKSLPSAPRAEGLATGEDGAAAIRKMAGCYLVDYNYVETEVLKPGYKRDIRVYDVNNKSKSVKEWIYAEDISPSHVRLQHILFAADVKGAPIEGSLLKHQAEDWEYQAPFFYELKSPSKWEATKLDANSKTWTRKITNLDDGLRYQCAAVWKTEAQFPEWTCDNYAPIPGRETRDMARKDYNTLQRSTKIVVYGDSWLERQTNTKISHEKKRVPLVNEAGKNWYVRLPDSDCAVAQEFVKSRKEFWSVLRETWSEVLAKGQPFTETAQKPPRYAKMMELEAKHEKTNLKDAAARAQVKAEIQSLISEYREVVK